MNHVYIFMLLAVSIVIVDSCRGKKFDDVVCNVIGASGVVFVCWFLH